MRKQLPFDGQLVTAEMLTAVEDDAVNAILARTVALTSTYGITSGLGVTSPLAYTLRIAPGRAYDSAGRRIAVLTQTDVAFVGSPVNYYVQIAAADTDGTPAPDPISGAGINTRRVGSFTVTVVASPSGDAVTLGKITAVDGGTHIATLDLSVAERWSPKIRPGSIADDRFDPASSVRQHLTYLGTGVSGLTNPHANAPLDFGITPFVTSEYHQAKQHTAGFERPRRAASLPVGRSIAASIVYQAVEPGQLSNGLTIRHVATGINTNLSVAVTGTDVTVNLATDELAQPISTASEVVAAMTASVPVSQVMTAVLAGDGSGTVETLDQTFLTGGTDEQDTTDFGRVTIVDGTPNSLAIRPPVLGDFVTINGLRYAQAFDPSTFDLRSAEQHAALYEVSGRPGCLASLGVRARYGTDPKTGVQLVKVDARHPLGRFGLVLTAATDARNASLSWANGPAVLVDRPTVASTNEKRYDLPSGLPGAPGISVWVAPAALAKTNEIDLIQIVESRRTVTDVPLASCWWAGRAIGTVGYGTAPALLDERPIGTLNSRLDLRLEQRMARMTGETRADGVLFGVETTIASGLQVATSAGLVSIDGLRKRVGPARVICTANKTGFLVVDETGTVRYSETDVGSFQRRFIRIARIETDASVVQRVHDERVLLPQVDQQRLLGQHLLGSTTDQQTGRLVVPQGPNGQVDDTAAARTELLFSQSPGDVPHGRVYLAHRRISAHGRVALEVAHNARWAPSFRGQTNVWVADDPRSDSILQSFRSDGLVVQHRRHSANNPALPCWGETGWTNTPMLADLTTSTLRLGVSSKTLPNQDVAGFENPAAGVPVAFRLLPKALIKAWATLLIAPSGGHGVVTLIKSYGIHSLIVDGDVASPGFLLRFGTNLLTFQIDKLPGQSNGGQMVDGVAIGHAASGKLTRSTLEAVGASRLGTATISFPLTIDGTNDTLGVKTVSGGPTQTLTIPHATYSSMAGLIAALNLLFTGGYFRANADKLQLVSSDPTTTSYVEVIAGGSALSSLYLTAGTATLAYGTEVRLKFTGNVTGPTSPISEIVYVVVFGSQVG